MSELIGKECACEFNAPPADWPFPGYPAWVRVLAVDMPMVKLASKFGRDAHAVWVNAEIIKTIRVA